MCQECAAAYDQLQAISALAEIEHLTMMAEQDAGLSSPNAVRPLTENEMAAKVRFGDIHDAQEEAEAEAEAIIAALAATVGVGIIGGILSGKPSVSREEAVRGLAALTVKQPDALQLAVAEAADKLSKVFDRQAQAAGLLLLEEVKRQGIAVLATYVPPAVPPMKLPAAVAAMQPYARMLPKVQSIVADPRELFGPDLTAEALQKVVDAIPMDGANDLARQGVRQAHGLGRVAAAADFDPVDIWASELLDGATCDECSKVDGKEYATLDEARKDYPGGYERCRGGARCRGTLVYKFATS